MRKAIDILKDFGKPTAAEERVLDEVLAKLGRGDIPAEDAIDEIMDRLDWPLDRAAAEVDAFLE